jgi:pyruvate formate lyase activating enzyme
MLCRIPLIIDVNDSVDNITATAKFVKTLGEDVTIELLPYHRLGIAKYQTLDAQYPGEAFTTQSTEQLEVARNIFEEHGVSCSIGG